jgi:AcrR family transcriptional regulator
MNTFVASYSRKKRQFLEREALILKTAQHILLEKGFHHLKMSQLAREVEYSTGTLYQHFVSKEDMLLALTSEVARLRANLFARVMDWEAPSRDRMLGLLAAEAMFICLHPGHFANEHLIYSEPVWSKASTDFREKVDATNKACINAFRVIVQDAVDYGDLSAQKVKVEEVTFAIWSMVLGVHTLVHSAHSLSHFQIQQPYQKLLKSMNSLMDGLGWASYQAEGYDFADFFKRVGREVFNLDMTDPQVLNFCHKAFS